MDLECVSRSLTEIREVTSCERDAVVAVAAYDGPASRLRAPPAQIQRWTFDTDAVDRPPSEATVFNGAWVVRAEACSPSPPNALCQTGQAAGLIFRIQDRDNYYILRANALEANVNLYIYRNGRRSGLKEGSATVASGQWQELRVDVQGNRFRGFLNAQPVVEASDASYKAGGIGLWTKSDSVTCFDDVQAESLA